MEQDTGVEPAFTAWEAVVLPIYESCIGAIIAEAGVKFNPFLSIAYRFFHSGRKMLSIFSRGTDRASTQIRKKTRLVLPVT